MSSLTATTRIASRHVARTLPALARIAQTRGFLRIVKQGHEGWRLLLGQSPTRMEPGVRLNIPILHEVQIIDMREVSKPITEISGFTSDNVPVSVTGSLFYQVRDSYKACFGVADVHTNIVNIGVSALRATLGLFTYDEIIADRARLNQKLTESLSRDIKAWGVDCTRFECSDFAPANKSIGRQLELQMEAERQRRKQLLDTEANVNVADGSRRQDVLISEGRAQAVVNEAEAARKRSVLEAAALAEQILALATALAGEQGESKPTTAHRATALETLVELQRLKQLAAVAEFQNNSSYFFGAEKSAGLCGIQPYMVDLLERMKTSSGDASKRTTEHA